MNVILIIFLLLVVPSKVWAYVDPGSIAIFMQVIVAFIAGFLIVARNNIKAMIKKIFGKFSTGKSKKNGKRNTDNL